MSIQSFLANFNPRTPLVDAQGIPTTSYGRQLLLGLWNRTGAGTGIIPVVSAPLTAVGNSQATALQLINDWNNVATVAAGTGVVIPAPKPGNDIEVFNGGANNLNVFPPIGFGIDALGVNAAYVLAPGKLRAFQCWSPSQFYSFGN